MTDLPGEDDLIARHFAPLAGPGGLGLRDDAALLRLGPGRDLVATVDALVAGVHFFPDDPLDSVAKKALRVNLSDLAAKGAEPEGFLLALALPRGFTEEALALFARGLAEDASAYGLPLLGGDTVATPGPLTISVTALGSVPAGTMLRRTGVQAGDDLYVTGTIGDAALGLALRLDPQGQAFSALDAAGRAHLLDRYLLPQPRNALAVAACGLAHGGMDVSDGLVGDLTKMLRVSGVTARIDLAAVPLSSAAQTLVAADPAHFERALTGGDDYELLLSAPPSHARELVDAAGATGLRLSRIGAALAGTGEPLFLSGGRQVSFSRKAFSHF